MISAAVRLTAAPFSTICKPRLFVCTAYLRLSVIAAVAPNQRLRRLPHNGISRQLKRMLIGRFIKLEDIVERVIEGFNAAGMEVR